ncbi:MAG: 5'-nucleotidase, lipoprotein e(P4) family [Treponema sp.]|jgi:5'-nucleotidase (lipoprotein e(P4) family)|nr:5'-nucleotidase, lipoprotein e(P4) family [Treponema sp.]
MNTRRIRCLWFWSNVVIVVFFSACVSTGSNTPEDRDLLNYNHDLLMGLLWQQNSGEYSALCYQAFNAGERYVASLPSWENKAIVFDIDETVLDNSKYAAWMVVTGNPWGNDTWTAWCNAREADAVPGSLDFARYLMERGIEIFYVSNRPASTTESTVKNLQNLGFPLADREHVFLQEDTSDKNPRLERIRALGYDIALFAGDSLEDFDSATRRWTNQERRNWADSEIESFGVYRIVLPNAVYGTFESAIVPNYYGLSPGEKARARLEKIKAWNP